MKAFILAVMTVAAIPVWGQTTNSLRMPTTVNSTGGGGDVAPIPSAASITRTYQDKVVVRIHNQCFGTNLRAVSNPVSPNGLIVARMNLNLNGADTTIGVTYPGLTAENGRGFQTAQAIAKELVVGPENSTASVFGNVVTMVIPLTVTSTTHTDGTVTVSQNRISVTNPTFDQDINCGSGGLFALFGMGCGPYMGQAGRLSGDIGTPIVAADSSAVDITASFPGENGFCGGYFSPLMVFMDEKRPDFTGASDFPLYAFGKTAWPEAGSPGHFIAMDRDGNGKIDKADELFGDNQTYKNGFEALAALDSNKDGWITSKDKDFKKLVLWNDKNGNGKTDKGEVVKLSTVVEKISLAYTKGHVRPIGLYAEEREKSIVILKGGKKVEVVDMWFAPALRSNEKLSDNRKPASAEPGK
ncbi:MAG: EF-hand domain-containing protein [Bdellovibrionaceae bacterium]|nr:EF-hand domain-containing protein [Pseudobdellovibrionaceae bacterium]